MSDLISRQGVLDWLEAEWDGMVLSVFDGIRTLPSAHSDLITWLLDEIWDEDMWELNWQAFPELLCRKLEKLGYVKRKGDEYERLDKQTGCN